MRSLALFALLLVACSSPNTAHRVGLPDGHDDGGAGAGGSGGSGPPALTIAPSSARLRVGKSVDFSASAAVTWRIVEGAAGGTVDANGHYTAPAGAGAFTLEARDAAGDTATAAITVVLPGLDLLAGSIGGIGTADGIGGQARFTNPARITVRDGVAYVAEPQIDLIRAITLATGQVRKLAGAANESGNLNGTGSDARFWNPYGVAADDNGNLYVADRSNALVRKIVIATGEVSIFAGGSFGAGDGNGTGASFGNLEGIVYYDHTLYVADTSNHTIRAIDVDSREVTTLAGFPGKPGSTNGVGTAARFDTPEDIASDGAGTLYVTDFNNGTLRKIVLPGIEVSTIVGTPGVRTGQDGVGAAGSLMSGKGIVYDGKGGLYVTDTNACNLRHVDLTSKELTTVAGDPLGNDCSQKDGSGTSARFYQPEGLAIVDGGVLVADSSNGLVRRYDLATGAVTTPYGSPTVGAPGDGVGPRPFAYPSGLAISGGLAYLADSGWNKIRAVDLASGALRTVDTYSVNGQAYYTIGVALDGGGHLFVSQWIDQIVRTLDLATSVSSPLAGLTDQFGLVDGKGTIARFNCPGGMAFDGHGLLYVADAYNNALRTIDVATGTVGTAIPYGSGLNHPRDVAFDGVDTVFIADSLTYSVKTWTVSTKKLNTLANFTQNIGYQDGPGVSARFRWPIGLAYDRARGFLYVADQANNVVRQIVVATGEVSTVVGVQGQGGVQLGALPAQLNQPTGLALTADGDLLITDVGEQALLIARRGE